MNYNEMFRVFDNGGETADRYTVFLADEPEQGALGLNDTPTHPTYGFSQFGDFDIDAVAASNEEISFDRLPKDVQTHVLQRFELTEKKKKPCTACKCISCGYFAKSNDECGACKKCGHASTVISDEAAKLAEGWESVVMSMLSEDKTSASTAIKRMMTEKLAKLVSQPLNELDMGRIKFIGDDVIVKGRKVGTIHNDLDDMSKGIVLKLHTGEEHDFTTIKDLMAFLMDEFRIKESVILEATEEQKYVVKALRQLAKKLDIPSPRFRSLGGKAQFVEMSPKNWKEVSIPNELRKKAVVKVFNAVPQDFSDVNYGNVRKESITLTVPQWKQLLGYYGIEIPESVPEGYSILPAIDGDRYPNRENQGLEGPFRAKNGKVVYYDPKEGKYYDPDSDIYLSFEEWEAIDESVTDNVSNFFKKIKSYIAKNGKSPTINQNTINSELHEIDAGMEKAKKIGDEKMYKFFAAHRKALVNFAKTGDTKFISGLDEFRYTNSGVDGD